MRSSRLIPAVALLAVLTAATAAASPVTFKGNVCALATARQVSAALHVKTRPSCTPDQPLPGPGSKIYGATWKAPSTTTTLHVTVTAYTDPGVLRLAKSNLRQGLPGGTPKKLTGLGSAAYQAAGAGSAALHFAVGKDIVLVTLSALSGHPRVTPELVALAKAIAAGL